MKSTVLRLGHRFSRDKRISTHIALVSRAFGAEEVVFDASDPDIEKSLMRVCKDWGGETKISNIENWKRYVENFPGEKIHLTMYGVNVNECIEKIRTSKKNKLIIVGGQKVPSEIYKMADYNVAIGNQPHSEVAALAVFMDRLYQGKEVEAKFHGKKTIIPQEHGKKVLEER
ncbi:MAG: tRNA (cytidine(56)-2'-O)-methyltransferase [Candidatus Altiarchaeia archaeon]|jgi:tRNA (cytidine56-2'-O)-methyltransferase